MTDVVSYATVAIQPRSIRHYNHSEPHRLCLRHLIQPRPRYPQTSRSKRQSRPLSLYWDLCWVPRTFDRFNGASGLAKSRGRVRQGSSVAAVRLRKITWATPFEFLRAGRASSISGNRRATSPIGLKTTRRPKQTLPRHESSLVCRYLEAVTTKYPWIFFSTGLDHQI